VITIHQRYRQTDGRTDRQTTCDRNTALCTKVHRAVIKWLSMTINGSTLTFTQQQCSRLAFSISVLSVPCTLYTSDPTPFAHYQPYLIVFHADMSPSVRSISTDPTSYRQIMHADLQHQHKLRTPDDRNES